ncbi:MAG: TIGR01906 family membrane protein [Firmicutes bacterium]|nr:TIGR01906 family membrane protein [Bacillota bacterium]
MKKESIILTIVWILILMLLVISGSIGLVLLIRPLYYMQIGPLKLEEVLIPFAEGARTLSRAEIIEAYDEMMDYCLGISPLFSTGVLAFSAEGASHFADVKGLFLLDLWVLGITGTLSLAWLIFRNRIPVRSRKIAGLHAGFWAGALLLGIFALIGILGAIDFDRFFTIFHHVFFPGKTNWIFDYRYDQIIGILPETVFSNFALMIVILILASCLGLIIHGILQKRKG